MARRVVRLKIDFDTLAGLLGLPGSARIYDVGGSIQYAGAVEFKVEDPSLPEVEEGRMIPYAEPEFELCDGVVTFFDWGLEGEETRGEGRET